MRFNNFRAGVRAVTLEVTAESERYQVSGWVDFKAGLGYAAVSDSTGAAQLIVWTHQGISSYAGTGSSTALAAGQPPVPPPGLDGAAWTTSELVPEQSRLHAALAALLQVGSDRPDNPQLLAQTDARWLRTDVVGGTTVDVVAGPTSDHPYDPANATTAPDGSDAVTRYWFDADNNLLRMELRLGGTGEWTAVTFDEAPGVEFAEAFRAAE